MEHQELYDKIVKVLTWWEHPEECPFENDKEFIVEQMYETLVQVQNEMFD